MNPTDAPTSQRPSFYDEWSINDREATDEYLRVRRLVREEPEWAISRIKAGDELALAVAEYLDCMDNDPNEPCDTGRLRELVNPDHYEGLNTGSPRRLPSPVS